jgi:hypothetical protein
VERGLKKGLVDEGRFPKCSVPARECCTCPRQDNLSKYKPDNQRDKQVKLVVLNYSSKQMYISEMKGVIYYRIDHQKHQIFIGQ